jgi:uncharacterized protein (DUF3084 family)
MPRIYASVEDLISKKIDDDAKEKSISRSQWVNRAINAFLHQGHEDVDQLHRELDQARVERETFWREAVRLRNEKEQYCTEAVQLQSEVKELSDSLEQARTEASTLREMMNLVRIEADKLKEAASIREADVAFLRGHVSQLAQSISQLSLPPAQEEARTKRWWQFW